MADKNDDKMSEPEHGVSNYLTMVQYDAPVLIAKHPDVMDITPGDISEALTPAALENTKKQTEDILNAILPSRCWEDAGQLWQQTISSCPATPQDVIKLQQTLDTRLTQTHARETGICPIRRELYSQILDELIRQITIECSERGLLLLRLRDEIVMTIEAYETLYASSVAFGLRLALSVYESKEELRNRVRTLEEETTALDEIVENLTNTAKQNEIDNAERRAADEKRIGNLRKKLTAEANEYKAQLEALVTPAKKT